MPAGGLFALLNANDFGTDDIDDNVLLVPGMAGGKGQAHLVVRNRTSHQIIIRTILDNPNPLGNIAHLGMPCGADYEVATGWADGMGLHLGGGASDVGLGEAFFPVDGCMGIEDTPSFSPIGTPSACMNPGHIGRLRMVERNGVLVYLVSCVTQGVPVPQSLSLWLGAGDSPMPPEQLATGGPTDTLMNPDVMAIVNLNLLTFFNSDFGPVAVSYGPQASDIASPFPFSLDATPSTQSFVFGTVPALAGDGVAILAATADLDKNTGALWAGALGPTELDTLGQTPPQGMKKILTAPDLTALGSLGKPTYDKDTFITAGPSIVMNGAFFSWFKRDTTPLVLQYPVVTSDGTFSILTAAAAPLGLTKLVIWVERDGASPPHYTVRGRKLLCNMGG